MTDIEALIERVERASEPRRQLDADIARDMGRIPKDAVLDSDGMAWHNRLGYEVPNYTASIDAAMTLVPEGCGWLAGWGQTLPLEPMGGARITRNARFVGYDANYDVVAEAESATPALALVAASLRAKATT